MDRIYWLNLFTLHVPPLHGRNADIDLLIRHLLNNIPTDLARSVAHISAPVLRMLQGYAWPGNVRELENTLERLVHMAGENGIISPDIVPAKIRDTSAPNADMPIRYHGQLAAREKETLLRVIQNHNGNLRAAAKELGVSRSGLYVKLKRFDISPDIYRHSK